MEQADKKLKKASNTNDAHNLSSNPIDNIVNQIEEASGVSAAKISQGHANNPYKTENKKQKLQKK